MKMHWKAFLGFVGVTITSLIFAGQLQAASVTSIWFTNEQNQSSDNDGEFLVNKVGSAAGDTFLDPGDVLISASNFSTNEDLTGGGGTKFYGTGGVNELTILSLIEVTFKGDLSLGLIAGAGVSVGVDLAGNLEYDFLFSPLTATGVAAIGAHPGLAAIAAEEATWAAGSMIAAFDDALLDYTRLYTDLFLGSDDGAPDTGSGPFVTEGLVAATAMNGAKILEVGFTGVAGEGWVALATPDDLSALAAISAATIAGGFNFGTNVTADFLPLWQFGSVLNSIVIGGTSQFAGSGSLLGLATILGPATTPYDAFSNVDITFAPIFVPEPSTLTLWSLGALALAGLGWRRRNRVR